MPAHGDLRNCGPEIEWRFRARGGRPRVAGAASLLRGSGRAQACPNRLEPPDRVDQRAPLAVPRRRVALQDLGDRFKGARGLGFGPLEPHSKALDHRIERAGDLGGTRRLSGRRAPRDALEPPRRRIEPVVESFVAAKLSVRIQARALGDRFI